MPVLINFGKIQEVVTEKKPANQQLHISLQLTKPTLNQQTTEKLPKEVNRNFSRKNGIGQIHKQHLWKNYFPHISSEGISKGALQTIHNAQGKHGLWYIGSSISGELTTLVAEFNHHLLNGYEMEEASSSAKVKVSV